MIINDNLLDKPIFNFIKNKIKNPGCGTLWNFMENTGVGHISDSPSFAMTISDQSGVYSPLYDLLCIPLIVACSKNNIKFSKIVRIRAGLIMNNSQQIVHTPHVDYNFPHKTMLFYLTDSDGPTLIYDKKHSGNEIDDYWIDAKMLKVETSVMPVENTCCIFDGLTFHSSTAPTENPFRIVINYNFID